jgi:ATP-dependent exoDNAse (exonuclease V) beta subunit
MVDEFQDTNELQFLISLLLMKKPNLCAVGDWKQGIYGFRYASIENLTQFEEKIMMFTDFLNKGEKRTVTKMPPAIRLPLTRNYRSSALVIKTAFDALQCRAGGEGRPARDPNITELKAERDTEHTAVERIIANDGEGEVEAILRKINEYVTDPKYVIEEYEGETRIERRPEYRDIAVLCKQGAMCIAVKNAAVKTGIPAHLQGDVSIMNTREGKLALAWLRYINDRNDIRGPVAILADDGHCLASLRAIFVNGNEGIPEGMKRQREKLSEKRHRVNDLFTSIFGYHGLDNDITHSLISAMRSAHADNMLTVPGMIRLMEKDMDVSSKYSVDSLLDGRSVMIQTMHKSKGLEYPIVIVGGLNRSTMPLNDLQTGKRGTPEVVFDPQYGIRMTREYVIHDGHHKIFDCRKWMIIKNAREPDWDGERRLFFVALSRAKQYIAMTCYNGRESSFINDIGGSPLTETETHLTAAAAGIEAKLSEPPVIEGYERRKKRISLHELMGPYEESGDGKGIEHGIRVHKDAQRIMNKLEPYDEYEETERLIEIRNSVKDAKIMTEVDCTYPIKDAVIAGRIDMIAIFDDRVEIHDYKTDMNNRNEERYRIQLSVYGLAARSLKKPVKCIIDYVSQGRSEEIEPVSEEEIYERIVINELK